MSKKKTTKKSSWGGARKGSGRPLGSGTKVKISVSVNAENWQNAIKAFAGTASAFIDKLIVDFIKK
jgi:hypothetical protein